MQNFRYFLILLSLTLFLGACKQEKIIKSSAPETPDWVYGLRPNSIIVYGTGNTHEEAQQQAFTKLKEAVVTAISIRVSSEISMQVSEKIANDLVLFKENTNIKTKVTSDFLNAINGLNLNKSSNFYWEVVRYRKSKNTKVYYHIQYPFTDTELARLVQEWKQTDNELNQQVTTLSNQLTETNSITQLNDINQIASKIAAFSAEPRKSNALTVQAQAENQIKNLSVKTSVVQPGIILYQISGNNRFYKDYEPPTFKSTCAELVSSQFSESDMGYLITFDTHFCDPLNFVEIILNQKIIGQNFNHKISVEPNSELPRIALVNEILCTPKNNTHSLITIPVRSLSDKEIEIVKVEINLQRNSGRALGVLNRNGFNHYIKKQLSTKQYGRGDFSLQFETDFSISNAEAIIKSIANLQSSFVASGSIFYQEKNKQKILEFKFQNQRVRVNI
jgi:hypothetical protein